ncbi:hypothetical protein [Pararhizobium arenae]|uniref:hypothetical protein n=1 Tax=Pararhizobium arenae TaxID=1856850 RepID=UPI00094B25C1|nr:hypothetical protein [Pararhizobium arenae]
MSPMKSISHPAGTPSLEDAVAAIKPSFDDLAELSDVNVAAAAGPDLPEVFEALARRAESVGWDFGVAGDAIRELARRRLGAEGTLYD